MMRESRCILDALAYSLHSPGGGEMRNKKVNVLCR